MKAYIFPGQGSQFTGMCQDLFLKYDTIKPLFIKAEEILEFDISKIMFEGSKEELTQTKVTQPAIFIHSMAILKILGESFKPDLVAGHSLGEFSALVASGVLNYEDGLKLVSIRAKAMQKSCEKTNGTMAAILALDNNIIEQTCKEIEGVVVAANYNCPGQVVISGELNAVKLACEKLSNAGARRALLLPVGGAFHSELMIDAKKELSLAIEKASFNEPICPIYQNVNAKAETSVEKIKENLISQLTSPVKWNQSIDQMIKNGTTQFIEIGPGKVLQGLVKKIDRNTDVTFPEL
ncbi:ACP S-malonyltransferase [Flavobacteriaceae bacterium]|jgi:[acyl-carrier-protein] S-malonyltransferase|nr:ACP S-malonyltransferase [Flavobacteriaceae bacterium]MDA9330377.1 ACP S-malonyltransferase [bacterium]MDB0042628.1 ACP S-malonyltransferase [Flavobacteriaceae bacterium]MDB0069013.1 ACP S-malonyltransferase [Flavobacteriaceae bacterium]MDB4093750.1 ACP S-malonyltransferase [Flavobacteriaceae bacterium]|tara:strand:+ start:6863 stop:7744 length:882 start_codon:yes stop_codon:yes gene_type:complete